MKDITLNSPCPCGSGRKFRDCCYSNQELYELNLAISIMSRMQSVEDLIKYASPLFGFFGENKKGVEKSINLAYICWQIAEKPNDERKAMLDELIKDYAAGGKRTKADAAAFEMLVKNMVERYLTMFPEKA